LFLVPTPPELARLTRGRYQEQRTAR